MMKLVIIILSFIMLSSCSGNNPSDNTEGSSDPQSDNQFMYYSNISPWQLAESDSHYYHIAGNYLYSISKADGKVRALDNHPDTLDDAETDSSRVTESNAFFFSPRSIQYVNGKLYVHAQAMNNLAPNSMSSNDVFEDSIFEADTAGSGQKEIFRAQEPLFDVVIHRGYIYISTSDAWNLENRRIENDITEEEISSMSYQVSRVPLSSPNDDPEVIYQKKDTKGVVQKMRAYGDYLHFLDGPLGFNEGEDRRYQHLVCDLNTNEVKPYVSEDMRISEPVPVKEGLLYYQFESLESGAINRDVDGVINKEAVITDYSGSPRESITMPFSILVYGYDDLLCLDNYTEVLAGLSEHRVLRINNLTGETLAELELPSQFHNIVAMTSEYIFIMAAANEGPYSEIHRIDLGMITSNDLRPEPFFTYQPPVQFPGFRFPQ